MIETIQVTDNSAIYIGKVAELLTQLLPSKRVIVISDGNIEELHPNLVSGYEHILIGQGEVSKSLATLELVYAQLIEMGVDRSCFILGVGGGIVTDITGFVASTYMRGLPFGFVTTTLLGAVDASVGGKNGVNVGGYKNMVGTFTQPKFVICDVSLLQTLPQREIMAGMAEVIKTAILGDEALFKLLENNTIEDVCANESLLSEVVTRSMSVKASVVARDEREGGLRRILNLGHTLAHAIERATSLYNHGEAVAVGLYHITALSRRLGIIGEVDALRIQLLIRKYGYRVDLPVDMTELVEIMRSDKKRDGHTIHLILPTSVGAVEDRVVGVDELLALFTDAE